MKIVSAKFEPGKPMEVSVSEAKAVTDMIEATNFAECDAVYFGVLRADGTLDMASFAESKLALMGMLSAHMSAVTNDFLGVLNVTDLEDDGEEEDEDA